MKYKDRRLTLFYLVFIPCIIAASVYFIVCKEVLHVAILGMMLLTSVKMFVTRSNCMIFDDSCIVYNYCIFAILPRVIEYKDIQTIELCGKHKVVIYHGKKSVACINDAPAFYDELNKTYLSYLKP